MPERYFTIGVRTDSPLCAERYPAPLRHGRPGYCDSTDDGILRRVNDEHEIHFVTGTGLLCGARLTEPWTVSEHRVTCEACRAQLAAGQRELRKSAMAAVIALTKVLKET